MAPATQGLETTMGRVVTGSPQGLHGDGTVLAAPGGWYQVWLGVVTFGGCCHPSHSSRVVLGFRWPGHPVLVVTAFLSPQCHKRGERGTEPSRWGGTMGHERGPNPHGVPNTLVSPQPGEWCPQAVPALGAQCLWRRRAPTPWRTMLSPT